MTATGLGAQVGLEPEQPSAAGILQAGMEAGEIGVWRWDIAAERLTWSDNMEAIHRLPPGRFKGTLQSLAQGIHPEDRERVLETVRATLAGGDDYATQYRVAPELSDTTRWLAARGRVIRGPDGDPVCVTGVCQDITEHKRAEAELAVRARQQEALAQLGDRALAGVSQQEIFAEAVVLLGEIAEADIAEILELSQDHETLVLVAGHGASAESIGQSVETSRPDTHAGATLRTKTVVVVDDFAKEDQFPCSPRLAAHDVQSGACVPIAGTEGNPFGVLAIYCRSVRCVSRTDRRFLQNVANALGSVIRARHDQERSELLIGELRHRVGNLFSLVQALHRQTGQNAHDARDLELKFGSRLAALATAHSLILDGGWGKTSLRSLLERTLAPYIERVVFLGTDVRLPADAAFSFSMALHELATNANKYGALAVPEGRILLDCHAAPDALGQKAVLIWKERDGPPPPDAESEGFGSKLISQIVERQLGGKVTREVEPDGLRFTMEFPIG